MIAPNDMTLRDWFAGMVVASSAFVKHATEAANTLKASHRLPAEQGIDHSCIEQAKLAYVIADAMLKARGLDATALRTPGSSPKAP